MKVLVGSFGVECNTRTKRLCRLEQFTFVTDHSIARRLQVNELFQAAGIEVVPGVYAEAHPAGSVTKEAFAAIATTFLQKVRDNPDIDGIFLFLHGGSNIQELEGGSGEHYLIREIRKIVGDYLPIAVAMDPHGNLSQAFVDQLTIIRCFRESPHTDRYETYQKVAEMLIDLLNKRRTIRPVYRKVPILLGGERSVSQDEPMASINACLDQVEQSERIMSASYHIGYLRNDSPLCGASVIVVPNDKKDIAYANQVADEIERYVISKRHEFHYHGLALNLEEAIDKALEQTAGLTFITDSGDNTTSGASGYNTIVLRAFLARNCERKVLFAAITDLHAIEVLQDKEVGELVELSLGMNEDEDSSPVLMKYRMIQKGVVHQREDSVTAHGPAITIRPEGTGIDIIVSSQSYTYAELHQFEAAGINYLDYDIIVVKQGYIWPELKQASLFYVMALTEGVTDQRTELFPYKRIMRPMFPLDELADHE